jgi:chaperonin cofactor prefoldin
VCELETELKSNGELLETYVKRLQSTEQNLRNKQNLTTQLQTQVSCVILNNR